MNTLVKKNVFLIFLLLGTITQSIAQLNSRVAYQGSYGSYKTINSIIDRYNAETSGINNLIKNVHVMSTVQIGLKYDFDIARVEATYHLLFNNRTGKGVVPGSTTEFRRDLFFRGNSYSLGLDIPVHERISFGGNLVYNQFKINSFKTGRTDKFNVVNQKYWSSQFFLSYNTTSGDFLSVSIRPYVEIPWESIELNDLDLELNPISANSSNSLTQKEIQYGVMFIFCNGRQ